MILKKNGPIHQEHHKELDYQKISKFLFYHQTIQKILLIQAQQISFKPLKTTRIQEKLKYKTTTKLNNELGSIKQNLYMNVYI